LHALSALAEGFDQGTLTAPVIAQRVALEKARDAYEAVAAGTAGRIVINP
jgi:hypothetical protein